MSPPARNRSNFVGGPDTLLSAEGTEPDLREFAPKGRPIL
jgi:hypothetical protein